MARQPAVADRFYPGGKKQLIQEVSTLLSPYRNILPKPAIAAVSPHAGYIYSGMVAAETLSAITIPTTVLILGTNHHGLGAPIALSKESWDTPLGRISNNSQLSTYLLESNSPILHDESAHHFEHSIEVQIPFLQTIQPQLTIVPISFSRISYQQCQEVGEILASAINTYQNDVLILASSDMTHYESREQAYSKDMDALSQIEQLNPKALYDTVNQRNISMCGLIPVTVSLIAAKILGAKTSRIIRYTDSGEVSGDTNQVVGYAGVSIS